MNKIPAGYKQTEVGIIPEDWEITTVGEQFSIQLGKMLDAEKNCGVYKPYIGNRAVQWGRIDANDLGEIRLTPSDLKCYRLQENDLLVCEGGEIGRAAIWNQPIECYFQKALHRLRPIQGCNIQLMLHMLWRMAFNGFLANFVTQTSIAHLPKESFEKVPFPLPPTKTEQTAIATALNDADALITQLEKLIAKKRLIKQGAMQQLLTGKKRLSGFDRHPDGSPKGYKQTELGSIPEDWELLPYEKAFDFLATASYSRAQLSENDSIGYVHYGDIHTKCLNFLDLDKLKLPTIKGELLKSYATLAEGDVIIVDASEDYVGVGKSVEVKNIRNRKVISGLHTFLLRGKENYLVNGFKGYIHSNKLVKKQMDTLATGLKVYGVSKTNLKRILIPLPAKTEQAAIAQTLVDMAIEIDALQAKLTKYKQIKQGMMQSLLSGKIRLI